MKNIKYLPLGLFIALGIKSLVLGLNLETVAGLFVLGLTAYVYEKHSNDESVNKLETKLNVELDAIKKELKDLENMKSKVTSMQMQQMRPMPGQKQF